MNALDTNVTASKSSAPSMQLKAVLLYHHHSYTHTSSIMLMGLCEWAGRWWFGNCLAPDLHVYLVPSIIR